MGAQIVSPRQQVPLFLSVSRTGTGGVAGLSPTVELRRSSDGFYLDFNDDTFKSSGWTTRKAALTDLGGLGTLVLPPPEEEIQVTILLGTSGPLTRGTLAATPGSPSRSMRCCSGTAKRHGTLSYELTCSKPQTGDSTCTYSQ